MKRILLVLVFSVFANTSTNSQQATGRTTPRAVSIVIEQPVDSSRLQSFLTTMRQNPRSKEAAEAHLSIAKLQYDNRAYNAALEDLRKIVRDYPKGSHSEEAAYYLIAALSRAHHHEEVIGEATNALALNPNNRWIDGERYFLGRAYYDLGQSDQALMELNHVVENHPNSAYWVDALRLIADAYKRSKQYEKAIEPLQKIVAESKDITHRSEAQLQLGWLYSKNDEIETAIAEYQKAAGMDASIAGRAGYETAYIYLNRGDYGKAKDAFQVVADKYPADRFGAQASFRVGYCLAESGVYELALQHLAKTDSAYSDFEQRDLLLWYKAVSYQGLDKLELAKLIAQGVGISDSTHPNFNMDEFNLWYIAVLEKRIEHLGQANAVLEELIVRYPKSALLKAAKEKLAQNEFVIRELEDEIERVQGQ